MTQPIFQPGDLIMLYYWGCARVKYHDPYICLVIEVRGRRVWFMDHKGAILERLAQVLNNHKKYKRLIHCPIKTT